MKSTMLDVDLDHGSIFLDGLLVYFAHAKKLISHFDFSKAIVLIDSNLKIPISKNVNTISHTLK